MIKAEDTIRINFEPLLLHMGISEGKRAGKSITYSCPFCTGSGTHQSGTKKGQGKLLLFDPEQAPGMFKCQVCGFGGDIISIWRKVHAEEAKEDYERAINEMADILGIGTGSASEEKKSKPKAAPKAQALKDPEKVQKKEKDPPKDYTDYYIQCAFDIENEKAMDYLQYRGISIETAKALRFGYDQSKGLLIMPCTKHYYAARKASRTEKAFFNPPCASVDLFNMDTIYTGSQKPVYITESIIDAASIIEAGGEAIALNGTGQVDLFIKRIKEKPTRRIFIIALDNDEAGRTAAEKLKAQASEEGIFLPFGEYIGDAFYMPYKDANELLKNDRANLEKRLIYFEGLAMQTAYDYSNKKTIDDFLNKVKTEQYKPIPTGIKVIDSALNGGFIKQTIVMLGAAPGAGKTALACQIFEEMAKAGNEILYINLEMSREQLLARSITRILRQLGKYKYTQQDILQGYTWSKEQADDIGQAALWYRERIAGHMYYNPGENSADLNKILETITEKAKINKYSGVPAPIVVIDYLQLITGDRGEEDGQIIKRAMKALKDYAIKYDSIVFVIMANNREANRTGKVSLESGRDTSAIEYSADILLGLTYTAIDEGLSLEDIKHKAEEAADRGEPEPPEMKRRTLKVLKTRSGKPNACARLVFNGASGSFEPDTERLHKTIAGRR